MTSKIHVCCDSKARPLSVVLTAGPVHDSTQLDAVLAGVVVKRVGRGRPRKRPRRLLTDKGYSYPRCRRLLRKRGIVHLIPERRDQRKQRLKKGSDGGRTCAFDTDAYKARNVVERCLNRLKQWRRVATRYDKRAVNYRAFVTLAAIMLWLT